jgi:hypothetical protein
MANWWPTNKWLVATITAAGTVAAMVWVGDGINTDEEKLLVISLVVQRLAAYWAKNDPDPVATGRDSQGRFLKRTDKAEA